jgi:hypothetical protein
MMARVQLVEVSEVVTGISAPSDRFHFGGTDTVMNAVVLEWNQQLPLKRMPKTQFCRDSATEFPK